jgi:putative N6-adenine-specific DNA methylase
MQETILVTCARGVAPVLADEIRGLGLEVIREDIAVVETRASIAEQMRLLLSLRTAQRVLLPVLKTKAHTPEVLYYKVIKFPWEQYFGPDGYVRVLGTVHNDHIRDDRFAYMKIKDALMDRMRTQFDRRPDSGPGDHGVSLYVHWIQSDVTLYLDLAGRPLSKRGYRTEAGEAPMQEVLAAAMLLKGGWKGDTPLVNPMGGSGTLAIEAAWLAKRSAPGLMRDNFGLFHLKTFDPALWAAEVERAQEAELPDEKVPPIFWNDIDPQAMSRARINAEQAGVDHLIRFDTCDFRESPVPEGKAWVAINPPYGVRLESDTELSELGEFYREIGQWLKGLNTGGHGLVITGNLALAKRFGLKLAQKHTLYNGAMECRLLGFDLFPPEKRG